MVARAIEKGGDDGYRWRDVTNSGMSHWSLEPITVVVMVPIAIASRVVVRRLAAAVLPLFLRRGREVIDVGGEHKLQY